MTRLTAMAEAKRISIEFRCVQHVNTIDGIVWTVSDWFDADSTVYSFENGRLLN